jgi:hypothetical protein
VTKPLAVKQHDLVGLSGERRRERAFDPYAIDERRQEAAKLGPEIAGEPTNLADELRAIAGVEVPELGPTRPVVT